MDNLYAQEEWRGHKDDCSWTTTSGIYKGECNEYIDLKTNKISQRPSRFGVFFNKQNGRVYFGKWVDEKPESYLDPNNAVFFTPENFLIENKLSFDEELKILNQLFITDNIPRPIIFYNKYWEYAPEIKKHIIEYVYNKKNNQKNLIDFKKIIKLKSENIIAYEQQYLNKKLKVSFSKNELKFKKIEKNSRTVYGNRSSISFFGWGGDDSYDECMRTRRYDEMRKEWGSCAAIQVPYYNLYFEYPAEKLQIICIDIEQQYFDGLSKLSSGDSVYILESIFTGFSASGEIYLKSCKGGN
jgi:hypothetical protein